MFNPNKIYRVNFKNAEQVRFTRITLLEDTAYGLLMELTLQEPPMSETDTFKDSGIREYRYLHEIDLTYADEDNKEA